MALELNIDVQWADGRLVHVHCVGEPIVAERRTYVGLASAWLDSGDVSSLDVFHEFLTEATRIAPDGGLVEVLGYVPEVFRILQLLTIEGPPPDPVKITLVKS
jgi:hypothetical protein